MGVVELALAGEGAALQAEPPKLCLNIYIDAQCRGLAGPLVTAAWQHFQAACCGS